MARCSATGAPGLSFYLHQLLTTYLLCLFHARLSLYGTGWFEWRGYRNKAGSLGF